MNTNTTQDLNITLLTSPTYNLLLHITHGPLDTRSQDRMGQNHNTFNYKTQRHLYLVEHAVMKTRYPKLIRRESAPKSS